MVALLTWWRRSPAQREAEILYLRQQLIVLKRSKPARPRLMATDRLIFVCLSVLVPSPAKLPLSRRFGSGASLYYYRAWGRP